MMDKTMSATVSEDGTTVTVDTISKRNGVAGEVLVRADMRYDFPDGTTEPAQWTVQGSTYGGPVLLLGRIQTWVREPERFGSFAADPREWMRRFVLNEC